jgi:hypothetical protein
MTILDDPQEQARLKAYNPNLLTTTTKQIGDNEVTTKVMLTTDETRSRVLDFVNDMVEGTDGSVHANLMADQVFASRDPYYVKQIVLLLADAGTINANRENGAIIHVDDQNLVTKSTSLDDYADLVGKAFDVCAQTMVKSMDTAIKRLDKANGVFQRGDRTGEVKAIIDRARTDKYDRIEAGVNARLKAIAPPKTTK